ncbi:hypothetical protein CBR_g53717 [Chara braunii]|uniref:CCHC-type domain-containing protein n=1 Tax=Chara braunii TaxID=69332 RepID=A0A388MB85_CHABU|nr:hypothetical protein CBR_g53717 [Chara braunii]|eukprot:GBG91826.1 hypothetical protein CBR_g53717 [Chara braunii]
MSSQGQHDRNEREREWGDWDRKRRDRDPAYDPGDRRPYRPPTCFACNEVGHYANQCPNRSKRYPSARPSTSTDSRRTRSPRRHESKRHELSPNLDPEIRGTISKLGKSVAAMEEHYAAQRAKKEQKLKKKLDKEEARRREAEEAARLEEERIAAEKKAWKRQQKKIIEDERRAEMQKDLQIQLAMHVGDLEDRLVQRLHQVVAVPTRFERGKKKVTYKSGDDVSSPSSAEGSDTSVTQELSARAERLTITEKRKRGPEPAFEDPSPPMEQPAKRTPKRGILKPVKLTGRLTRSKSKKGGGGLTPTSASKKIATPLSKKRTPTQKRTPISTPLSKVSLERLRYRDNALRELKDLDATELQRICREEDIHYDKKIEVIFDIVDHMTERAFSTALARIEHIAISDDTHVDQEEATASAG